MNKFEDPVLKLKLLFVWNLTPIWQLASTLPSTYLSIFIVKIPLLDQNLSYEILPNMSCQNNLGDNYLWFWKHHWRFVRTFLWEVFQNHLGNTSIMSSLWNPHNALGIHNLVRKTGKHCQAIKDFGFSFWQGIIIFSQPLENYWQCQPKGFFPNFVS